MPRRAALSGLEWAQLLAVPADEGSLLREYTFTSAELELIRLRRGDANRLGFAVQLACMRFPGIAFGTAEPEPPVLAVVASQLGIPTRFWAEYGAREETRWEHRADLQALLGLRSYTDEVHAELTDALVGVAVDTTSHSPSPRALPGCCEAGVCCCPRLRDWTRSSQPR